MLVGQRRLDTAGANEAMPFDATYAPFSMSSTGARQAACRPFMTVQSACNLLSGQDARPTEDTSSTQALTVHAQPAVMDGTNPTQDSQDGAVSSTPLGITLRGIFFVPPPSGLTVNSRVQSYLQQTRFACRSGSCAVTLPGEIFPPPGIERPDPDQSGMTAFVGNIADRSCRPVLSWDESHSILLESSPITVTAELFAGLALTSSGCDNVRKPEEPARPAVVVHLNTELPQSQINELCTRVFDAMQRGTKIFAEENQREASWFLSQGQPGVTSGPIRSSSAEWADLRDVACHWDSAFYVGWEQLEDATDVQMSWSRRNSQGAISEDPARVRLGQILSASAQPSRWHCLTLDDAGVTCQSFGYSAGRGLNGS